MRMNLMLIRGEYDDPSRTPEEHRAATDLIIRFDSSGDPLEDHNNIVASLSEAEIEMDWWVARDKNGVWVTDSEL